MKKRMGFTALGIVLFGLSGFAHAGTVNIGGLVEWTCPGPSTGGPVTDAGGDRLYLRVVDNQGNDLEVWCMQYGLLGRHRYEYWVSYPSGKKTKISECELLWGNNVNSVTVNGNQGKTEGRVPGGGKSIRYKGRFGTFKHHNYNNTQDFHFTYDYRSGKWHRYNTEKYTDSKGKKREKATSFDDGQFSLATPPPDLIPDNRAFVLHSFPELADENVIAEAGGCSGGGDEFYPEFISFPVEKNESGARIGIFDVLYPADVLIEDIWFNEPDQDLRLNLSEDNERAEIHLIIPQGLVRNKKAGHLVVVSDDTLTSDVEEIISDRATILTIKNAEKASSIKIQRGKKK